MLGVVRWPVSLTNLNADAFNVSNAPSCEAVEKERCRTGSRVEATISGSNPHPTVA